MTLVVLVPQCRNRPKFRNRRAESRYAPQIADLVEVWTKTLGEVLLPLLDVWGRGITIARWIFISFPEKFGLVENYHICLINCIWITFSFMNPITLFLMNRLPCVLLLHCLVLLTISILFLFRTIRRKIIKFVFCQRVPLSKVTTLPHTGDLYPPSSTLSHRYRAWTVESSHNSISVIIFHEMSERNIWRCRDVVFILNYYCCALYLN